ncbi:MAG TPA: NAD(P)-dependent oxidoreductase [Solirubrobacteraceae bacterium]|jgi:3-hydroxyisobutyrate dehydrogenase
MRAAVLGTGIMGAPMARNIAAAGHDVVVWNRTPAKAEGLGARVAGSPAEAVEGAEAVITMLSDGAAVMAAMDGVALGDGQVWWQASTVGLEATARLAERAGGAAFVDAPVLGTRKPAEDGTLIVLASGPPAAREKLAPLFEAVAAKTIDAGDEAGASSRLKLVLNAWIVALVESLAETIALAEGLGVDPRRFFETIAGGTLDSPYAQAKGKLMLARDYEPASFKLSLAAKDARLALEAGDLELPLLEAVRAQMDRAVEAGHGERDMAATIEACRAPS